MPELDPGDIDIMAIVVIPLEEEEEEELMEARSEVLVSMAMLALGGELAELGMAAIEGMESIAMAIAGGMVI